MQAENGERYLTSARFVDSANPAVRDWAHDHAAGHTGDADRAAALFAAVRDGIWYDPFTISADPEDYTAGAVVASTSNWCVPKAVLLTAAARAVGIPARIGFADVRNHLNTPRLRERMGGADEFVYHGYTDLLVDGRWVKATPAFNAELCARFGVDPIEFDGVHDALLHPFSADGSRYMEYGRDRGVHVDLPLDELFATFREVYPPSMFGEPAGEPEITDAFTAPGRA
jgi:transglutaminase-like putative cysteine protease